MSTKLRGKNRYYPMYDLPGSMPSTGLIQYHREMAQRMLKRTLRPNECVVRKDRNRENNKMENLMVFANKGGARRYYSKKSQEFLFRREDGVYDYDWEAIKQQKEQSSNNFKDRKQKIKERNEKLNIFVQEHPDCTLKEIASMFFDGKESTARTHLDKHNIKLNSINYNHSNAGVEKLRSMTREELITYLNKHKTSGKDLAKTLNTGYYSVVQTLSERGVSTIGKHKKFKHLTRKAIQDALATKPTKQKLATMLGVFEENLEVELWKLGIKTGYKMSFVKENYVMPTDKDYENDEKHEETNKMTPIKHENLVEEVVAEVQNKDFTNFDPMINNKEENFNLLDAYNLGLTFNDIKFLTRLGTKDIVDSESLDINMEDINRLLEMRKVLTRDNMIALYKAGHSTREIANIYGYEDSYVYHISETI